MAQAPLSVATSVPWRQLKDEARRLALEIGASAGREHHSLTRDTATLTAIRAQGVPPEHREWVWPILLHQQNAKLQRQSSSFATYHELSRPDIDAQVPPVRDDMAVAQHDDDANADDDAIALTPSPTQPPSPLAATDTSSLQQAQELAMERFVHLNPFQERKIKRILVAYTKSKDVFYYCHGMVEICVVLSTFLVEEDAFYAFRLLLEVLLPKYHEESIVDFQTDCLVLQELLAAHDAALCAHFATLGITIQLLCTKWFFSFFAESMPFDVVCRLYDILLVDIGSLRLSAKIIFSTSLAVFLYLSATLVEVSDPSVVVEIICEFCYTTLSEYSVAESFMDLVVFVHAQVNDDDVAALRRQFVEQLTHEHEQRRSLQRKLLRKKTGGHSTGSSSSGLGSSSSKQLPRKGRIQSIRLLIQWRKHIEAVDAVDANDTTDKQQQQRTRHRRSRRSDRHVNDSDAFAAELQLDSDMEQDDDARDSNNGDVELEFVTTPSEKEVLAKVYEGINKINRRRSRSSSLRHLTLRTSDGASFHQRTLSSSSSLSNSANVLLESDDESCDLEHERRSSVDDASATDDRAAWVRLAHARRPAAVAQQSFLGVPDEHRNWVWPLLLHQIAAPPHLPQTRDFSVGSDNERLLDREIVKSIENDIARTRSLTSDQVAPMRRVLVAFASRNRRVGYCQGMNEILAVLLQYLGETEALLALVVLIEVLLPAYHVDSMIGLHTDCAVMNSLLKQNDAELHAHLTDLGLNMEILCTKWLVTCFLTSLPSFCGLKVLDMLLARAPERQRASRVLLGVGISIFFVLRGALLDAKDAGEVLLAVNEHFAREMAKTPSEMDKFLAFARAVIEQLPPDVVEDFRLVHKDEVMERFAAFEAKKIEMRHQLEEAKAKARAAAAPPSPPAPPAHRYSISSLSSSGGPRSSTKKTGLSSYISKPILGSSSNSNNANAGTNSNSDVSYRRVDVVEANRSFTDDLLKMEEQLDDLAELYERGKIDEKEHSCIRAQIVRKWCKGMHSPQAVMLRVRRVKASFDKDKSGGTADHRASLGRSSHGSRSGGSTSNSGMGSSPAGAAAAASAKKAGSVSLYGRMKKAKKSAYAIFKSTFE